MMKRVVLSLVLVVTGVTLALAQQGGYKEPTSDAYRKIVDGKTIYKFSIK